MIETQVADPTRKLSSNGTVDADSTMTQLISGIAEDAQQLIRQQYQMLRAEIRQDIKRTISAVKFLSVGAVCFFIGMLFLVVSFPLLLNWLFALPPWAGWMIIGGSLILIGGIALFVGKRMFNKFNPLPDKTLNALEENISWMTTHRN